MVRYDKISLKDLYLMTENVAQAEKILRLNNVPLDDGDYLRFKEELTQDNSIGYLGPIIKMEIKHGVTYSNLINIYGLIKDNRNIIKELPKQLQAYDNSEDFTRDLKSLRNNKTIKTLAKKLTNTNRIKSTLINSNLDDSIIEDITNFLNLKSNDQKEFLTKSDKYDDLETFLKDLKRFNSDIHTGFNYNIVLSKIQSLNESDIRILIANKDSNMIVVRILTYEASRNIGSTSWCIVGDESYFDSYINNGENNQYFFFNFNSDIPSNLKMIAFTMNEDGQITASHDRYDNEFSQPLNYLEGVGIAKKMFTINSREHEIKRLAKLGAKDDEWGDNDRKLSIRGYEKTDYRGNTYVTYSDGIMNNIKNIGKIFLIDLTSNKIKNKQHIDILFKKFENYPQKIYRKDGRDGTYDSTINIITNSLHNFDDVKMTPNQVRDETNSTYDEYGNMIPNFIEIDTDKLLDVLTKVYTSKIDMGNDTKRTIMHFLKDNGIDLLKLTQQKKHKTGDDLSQSEFQMLTKRGEDLKPIIQNKLSAIRRGEDVNMNSSEINYAIDNGYKNIISKYYKNMIQHFGENQLNYDDAIIYDKLGMFNEIGEVISKKGENFGSESLNSIEKSIFDAYNRAKIK